MTKWLIGIFILSTTVTQAQVSTTSSGTISGFFNSDEIPDTAKYIETIRTDIGLVIDDETGLYWVDGWSGREIRIRPGHAQNITFVDEGDTGEKYLGYEQCGAICEWKWVRQLPEDESGMPLWEDSDPPTGSPVPEEPLVSTFTVTGVTPCESGCGYHNNEGWFRIAVPMDKREGSTITINVYDRIDGGLGFTQTWAVGPIFDEQFNCTTADCAVRSFWCASRPAGNPLDPQPGRWDWEAIVITWDGQVGISPMMGLKVWCI